MTCLKKVFLGILVAFLFFTTSQAFAVNNKTCRILDDRDDVGNPYPFSLRHRVNANAQNQNAACTDEIKFGEGSYNIILQGALTLGKPSDSNGFTLQKGDADSAIIDATGLGECPLNLNNDQVKCVNIEIHSKFIKNTICKDGDDGRGALAPGSNCTIIADDDRDRDGVADDEDKCPDIYDDQTDSDGDGEGDACDNTPQPNSCGNGTLETDKGEQCDGGQCCTGLTCQFKPENTTCDDSDSNTVNDKCNAVGICAGTPSSGSCGNGTVDGTEQCDSGAANGTLQSCCDSTCNFKALEALCDDGSATTAGDKCNATGVCAGTPIPATCGNGTLEGTEACDDSNTTAGDGCSAACTVEPGYTCSGTPSVCTLTPVCGNGTKEGAEGCDDSNTTAGDGCSATCTVETGFTCTDASPSVCTATGGGTTGGSVSPPAGSGSTPSDSIDSGPTIGLGNGTNTGGCGLMQAESTSSLWITWISLGLAIVPGIVLRRFNKN